MSSIYVGVGKTFAFKVTSVNANGDLIPPTAPKAASSDDTVATVFLDPQSGVGKVSPNAPGSVVVIITDTPKNGPPLTAKLNVVVYDSNTATDLNIAVTQPSAGP